MYQFVILIDKKLPHGLIFALYYLREINEKNLHPYSIIFDRTLLCKSNHLKPEHRHRFCLYAVWRGAWLGIAPGQKVNMVVDGYSLSTTSEADGATISKVTLPANFVGKTIPQAEVINWISGGKVYHCNADNLPLIVMNGTDFNSSTKIHFDCQVVGP